MAPLDLNPAPLSSHTENPEEKRIKHGALPLNAKLGAGRAARSPSEDPALQRWAQRGAAVSWPRAAENRGVEGAPQAPGWKGPEEGEG